MINFKNVSGADIYIDNLVQIDKNTPSPNDGVLLDGQTLDFNISFRTIDISLNDEIGFYITNGDIVFVFGGVEQTVLESISLWNKGPFFWAIREPAFAAVISSDENYQKLIVDSLENRVGNDRLDASAIKNLPA